MPEIGTTMAVFVTSDTGWRPAYYKEDGNYTVAVLQDADPDDDNSNKIILDGNQLTRISFGDLIIIKNLGRVDRGRCHGVLWKLITNKEEIANDI